MLEYYRAHPLTAVLVIAAIIAAVVIFIKVAAASERRARNNQKYIKKLEEDKKLREKYSSLSAELISSSAPEELFRGVGLNLLKRVADKPDMQSEFDSLTEDQKLIYSAFVFAEDSAEGMSNFFKLNGKPVTGYALKAAQTFFDSDFASLVKFEYDAYDGDNEEVSCIPSEIEEADNKAKAYLTDDFGIKPGNYIKENSERFI
ncbi:MAG: hypothetical protein IKS39_08495 [Clostridia bacterium]|nr:hypothetical protein [Clostridia bacterium]